MDSNFQFRDAPPTTWAPSCGGEWAPRAAENRSIGFAEADDCRDDTAAPTVDRPQNSDEASKPLAVSCGTKSSNPFLSSGESANSQFLDAGHSLPMVADEKAH
jgi:hypothetical protein